jgi:hypothetical protein
MAELYTDQMSSGVSGISTNARSTVELAKLKITLNDNEKIPFDEAIKNIDRNLQKIIVETNDTLEKVRDEYQKRIDDQNCRSDLFWRVTSVDADTVDDEITISCVCVKLSPTYPVLGNSATNPPMRPDGAGGLEPSIGFSTSALMWYTGPVSVGGGVTAGITSVAMTGDGTTIRSDGSAFDTYLEPDNLHGLLLYNEPYARDIGDFFVATGIGTISAGLNTMTLLTPNLNLGIATGMVVTPSRLGIFASGNNTVVGVGTTIVDLRPYGDVIASVGATSIYTVPLITLQDPAVGLVTAPGSDGNYTYFDFSKDPNLISDKLAVDITDQAYVPQVISLMVGGSGRNFGEGVKIKYINNGVSPATQEWNAFLEGLPEPDQNFEKIDDTDDIILVEPPKIGAGKIYYPIGFGQKPILLGGSDASEGDTRTFEGAAGYAQAAYASLSACNDTALNAAIGVRNTAESALSGSNSFPEKVSLVNSIRSKRNNINITIWAYRGMIGNSENEFTKNEDFMNNLDSSPYKDLINTGVE